MEALTLALRDPSSNGSSQAVHQPLGNRRCFGGVRVHQDNGELVAAQPDRCVDRTKRSREASPEVLEQ